MAATCSFCLFCSSNRLQLIKHTFESHSFEPTFTFQCGIHGCMHLFKIGSTYSSWKTHVTRKHPNWQTEINHNTLTETVNMSTDNTEYIENDCSVNELNELSDAEIDDNIEETHINTSQTPIVTSQTPIITSQTPIVTSQTLNHDAKHIAALFLLTFKERYKLPQTSIDFAVGAINGIISSVCSSSETVGELKYEDPFSSLTTEYQQNRFYRDEFGLVEPITVRLGSSYKYKKRGSKRQPIETIDTCQYVPLIRNLEWLLQNKDFYNEVFKPREEPGNGYMYDYCDGQIYKTHPLFTSEHSALQLIAYFDDVETSNPLGSYRTKHKLSMFYYVIGNIEPKLRSSLRCIQLIACVKTKDLEHYGFRKVLQPFIEDVNRLYNGVSINIQGKQKLVKGTVLFLLADTIGAHEIGGFKLGLSRSFRKCRQCLASHESMSTKFLAKEFTSRTIESYNYHTSLLNYGPLQNEDSTTYGVTDTSILNDITSFNVINQLPQDVMHVLLEGVIPHELQLMLYSFIIERKLFTLDFLNERISAFCYSTNEVHDKPTPLTQQAIQKESFIRQSSAQVWTLSINLPLMIGDKIPLDDNLWECYLLLLDILTLCMARVLTSGHAGYLEALIHDHHQLFIRCYTQTKFIPKMHYMVHLPQQIIKSGPLINTWCMRMEAKNKYFKETAHNSNFKNVCLTVARRHQKLLCAYVVSNTFFDRNIDFGPTKELDEVPQLLHSKIQSLEAVHLFWTNWVKNNGVKYKPNDYVMIGWQDDDLPIFGRILKIYITSQTSIFFKVMEYSTLGIDHHFHSFALERFSDQEQIVSLNNLTDHTVYNSHLLQNGSLYITFRFHVGRTSAM